MTTTETPQDAKPTRKTGIAHLIASTGYSLSGLRMAFQETAIRHELLLGVIHFTALAVLPLSLAVRLVLIAVWFAVVIAELLNTAIEAVVDLASPERHPLAKRAKDVASAAVFMGLVLLGVSWALTIGTLVWERFG